MHATWTYSASFVVFISGKMWRYTTANNLILILKSHSIIVVSKLDVCHHFLPRPTDQDLVFPPASVGLNAWITFMSCLFSSGSTLSSSQWNPWGYHAWFNIGEGEVMGRCTCFTFATYILNSFGWVVTWMFADSL